MTHAIKWAVAAVSALALALLTLGVDLPWPPFRASAAAPEAVSCPTNAKPANLNFTLKDLSNREVSLSAFKGKVILNYSLNSPKETEESLLQSVEAYKKVASILGEERVFPLMFFLGIQPNTDLEQRLLEEGYLSAGYNPLMLTPTSIRKLLYNPAPLNKIIAKACLRAWERKQGSRDPRRWTGSLSQTSESPTYADQNLSRGIEGNSGRDALLSLEEILRSRRSVSSPSQAAEPRATSAG